MNTIKEYPLYIWEALGVRRFLIAAAISTVIGILDFFAKLLGQEKFEPLFGIPNWIVGAFVFLCYVAFSVLKRAVEERRRLTPKLQLSFQPEGGGMVETPEKERDIEGKTIREYKAVYLRLCVEAVSDMKVRECSAFLTRIQTKSADGAFADMDIHGGALQLAWAHIGPRDVDVPHLIKRYADILKATDDNRLKFTGMWPLALRGAFNAVTTYRLTIAVVGEGMTKSIIIDVDWNGKWDEMKAREVLQAA